MEPMHATEKNASLDDYDGHLSRPEPKTCDRCGDMEGPWVSVYEISWHPEYDAVCGSCLLTAAVDPFGEDSQ